MTPPPPAPASPRLSGGVLLSRELPLVIEQPFLAPETAAVTAEGAVGADDAMTRDDDRESMFVPFARPTARRAPGIPRRSAIKMEKRVSRRPGLERGTLTSPHLEIGSDRRKRDVEFQTLAREITSELGQRICVEIAMLTRDNRRSFSIVAAESSTRVPTRADR